MKPIDTIIVVVAIALVTIIPELVILVMVLALVLVHFYPSRMAGGGYSRDGGVMLSRGDPSTFGSVTDGQYCVRIIDESLCGMIEELM